MKISIKRIDKVLFLSVSDLNVAYLVKTGVWRWYGQKPKCIQHKEGKIIAKDLPDGQE